MSEWIILDESRAINLSQVSDVKFVNDSGIMYATVRLASFNPISGDKEDTTWFNVTGKDLVLLRACITRHIAPEFEGRLGPGCEFGR